MGITYLAAASKSGGTNLLPILFIVVLFVLLYMVMIRPQRNRQRQAQANQRAVVPGQRVRTTAGIYGTVTAILDDDLELEIAPGVRIRIMRRAVLDVVPDEINDPVDTGQGYEQPDASDGNGQAASPPPSSAAGESPADERNTQDRI
jgi:preprotein translocase subunit YajC